MTLSKLLTAVSVLLLTFTATAKNCNELQLPITFDQHGLPTIAIELNGKSYQALLDLGSKDGIHLPKTIFEKIAGISFTGKTVKSSNITGEVFEAREFLIPTLELACMPFKDITGLELNAWAASIGEQNVNVNEEQIVVGLGLFNNKAISLDYKNNMLTIRNQAIEHKASNSIPFIMANEGITIALASKKYTYQMVLDTGASSSIFVADKVNADEAVNKCQFDLGPNLECKLFSSTLAIAGHQYQANILLYPIDQRFKMDGLLGSDFFKQFTIDINFINNTLSLMPNS